MKSLTKDNYFYEIELIKSSNTLLVYANTLLGHFDKSATLEDIISVLSDSKSDILTDRVYCQIRTSDACDLLHDGNLDNNFYLSDCSFIEIIGVLYDRKLKYSQSHEYRVLPEMLNTVLQYGVFERSTFSEVENLGFRNNIESVRIVFKDVKGYSIDDINTFLSHIYFVD